MLIAPPTIDEQARIDLLHTLQLLDSPPEPVFDRITRLAARLLDVPIALVSLIDTDRQWFKSRVGLDATETPRELAFCAHAIHDSEPLVVNDARDDVRFFDNPLVIGDPKIRFYAGAPIVSTQGIALGTLCIIDRKPRELSADDLLTLQDLTELARREIMNQEAALLSRTVYQYSRTVVEESEARFRATVEHAPVGIAIVGTDGRWIRVNAKLCNIVGYSEAELLQLTFQDITHPQDLDIDLSHVGQMLRGEIDHYTLEKRYLRKNGEPIWISLTVSLVHDSAGQPQHFISVIEDIQTRKETEEALRRLRLNLEDRVQERTQQLQHTNDMLSQAIEQQRRIEESLRNSQEQLRTIANNLPVLIAHVDADLVINFVNEAYRGDAGVNPEQALGKKLPEVLSDAFFEKVSPHIATVLGGEQVNFEVETNFQHQQFWSSVYIPDIQNGKTAGFYIMAQDITDRKLLELTLQRKATRDNLTGLFNRSALMERLHQANTRANASGDALGVLFLDLDNFKQINDSYGHDGGDTALKHFAELLTQCVRGSDTVARLAGDEFVILLESLTNGSADAENIAAKIQHALREPIIINGVECRLSASIGVYLSTAQHTLNPEQMIGAADLAMYQAKRSGKNQIRIA